MPAEAFYEWVGPKKERQPLNIARADGKLLSMAGLFNYWKPAASEGRPMLTFTVVTTAPSRWMARIHNRMPVILQDNQIDTWLDPTVSDPGQLSQLAVLFWPDGRLIVSCGQRTDACPDGILSL